MLRKPLLVAATALLVLVLGAAYDSTPRTRGAHESTSILNLHFEGSNGSTSFVDSSFRPITVTRAGTSTISTVNYKYGSGSLANVSGGYLALDRALDFGNTPFTIEGWFRWEELIGYQGLWEQTRTADGDGYGMMLHCETNNVIHLRAAAVNSWNWTVNTGVTPVVGTWYHIAVERTAKGVLSVYIDGVLKGSVEPGYAPIVKTDATFKIGRYSHFPPGNTSISFRGNIDDFRITFGRARYGAAFSPPTVQTPDGIPLPTCTTLGQQVFDYADGVLWGCTSVASNTWRGALFGL